ncbi:MAG: hypothetical protein RL726_771 [Actinomycetota bacterium]
MTVHAFDRSLDRLGSVSLEEISLDAPLMRRYDHKYVTAVSSAAEFIDALDDQWCALRFGVERSPRYHTVYFDDVLRRTYRDHVQGRRPRFKVRSRTYEDGSSFLEVKLKSGRGQTDKSRIPRLAEATPVLTDAEHAWLGSLLPGFDTRTLRRSMSVDCRRITLHSPTHKERVTIDHSLAVALNGDWTPLLAGGVVIETKSETYRSHASHLLTGLDIRPVSFSKYCAGLSVVDASVHPRIRVDAERAMHVGASA